MIPQISPWLFRLFLRYVEYDVGRSFHAVRVSRAGAPPQVVASTPIIVYLNHPSWWDPMIGLVLGKVFWPGRRHYAPIDEVALRKYRFLSRLGFFGIAKRGARGGAAFLRTSMAILGEPGTVLWITGEGDFCDPRKRPVQLRPGLAHLVRRAPQAVVVPLALEYPFWQERWPEALCRFGPAIVETGCLTPATPTQWSERLQQAIEATQDALAAEAIGRRQDDFETLLTGRVGVGFAYDSWRRFRSRLVGQHIDLAHGGEA